MRFAPVALALPALAAAQQIPLLDQAKGWFNQAKDLLQANVGAASSSASSVASSMPTHPTDAAAQAAKQASMLAVTSLNKDNYRDVLVPGSATSSPGIEEWMVYTTGGNRTCFGMCDHADTEWTKAVAILSARPSAPNLGHLNCEQETALCNAWAAGAPSIIYVKLPQPLADQSIPATTVYHVGLNRTEVTAQQIVSLYTDNKVADTKPYEGFFHPFDGPLAKTGLAIPFGYVVYGFSVVPSWAMMIGISFFSRTFMSKRMQPAGRPAAAAPAQ